MLTLGTILTGRMVKSLVFSRHYISSYWYPNQAADPAMHNIMPTIFSWTKHLWSGIRNSGWYLNYLAVNPAHHSQGYGRALVEWGIERATQEHVAVSVISGWDKMRFYRRCGFDVQAGRVSDGEGNLLKGKVEGGVVLFRDPRVE